MLLHAAAVAVLAVCCFISCLLATLVLSISFSLLLTDDDAPCLLFVFGLRTHQADVFVAADSSFSLLVAQTTRALTVVPTLNNSDSKRYTTLDERMCNENNICAGKNDEQTVFDYAINMSALERLLLF